MKLARFRLTVGALVVAVAIAGIISGGWVLRQRSRVFRQKAIVYANAKNTAAQKSDYWRHWVERSRKALALRRKLDEEESAYEKTRPNPARQTNQKETTAAVEEWETRLAHQESKLTIAMAMKSYYSYITRKYERLSRQPWTVLAPDPPPPDPEARVSYWLRQNRYEFALKELERIIRSDPKDPSGYNDRARILATCPDAKFRNGPRAVESATRACELSRWRDPFFIDTLAAAYARIGQFETAVRWQAEAMNLVPPTFPVPQEFKARLLIYEKGIPYEESERR